MISSRTAFMALKVLAADGVKVRESVAVCAESFFRADLQSIEREEFARMGER